METKVIAWIVGDLLGMTGALGFINFGDFKSFVVFFLCSCYVLVRLVFAIYKLYFYVQDEKYRISQRNNKAPH